MDIMPASSYLGVCSCEAENPRFSLATTCSIFKMRAVASTGFQSNERVCIGHRRWRRARRWPFSFHCDPRLLALLSAL